MKFIKCALFGFLSYILLGLAGYIYPVLTQHSEFAFKTVIGSTALVGLRGGLLTGFFPKVYGTLPTENIYIKSLAYFTIIIIFLLSAANYHNPAQIFSIETLVTLILNTLVSALFAFLNSNFNKDLETV